MANRLADARSHLGAALMQALPSDDQIVMQHVRDAYELLKDEEERHRPHTHRAHYEDGKLQDVCDLCNHDIRHEIHLRIDRARVRELYGG